MTLNSRTDYPSTRSYVLKLHRDAKPHHDQIAGRLENMASGHCFDFSSAEQLLACLAQDITSTMTVPEDDI